MTCSKVVQPPPLLCKIDGEDNQTDSLHCFLSYVPDIILVSIFSHRFPLQLSFPLFFSITFKQSLLKQLRQGNTRPKLSHWPQK